MAKKSEAHLKIFAKRSEFVSESGQTEVFQEGPLGPEAKKRSAKIEAQLKAGFLVKLIGSCKENKDLDFFKLTTVQTDYLTRLIEKVNANEGRALVGLSILQLTIKSIEPSQNIRLHKGGDNATQFSWVNGISMRSIDNTYVTPALRQHHLLSLNADGIMMTRSLAENYPYSRLYKAQLKGPRSEWLDLVEDIESEKINPEQALKFLICKLTNRTNEFQQLVEELIAKSKKTIKVKSFDLPQLLLLFKKHLKQSNHAARVMEVQMHTFIQALNELGWLDYRLGALSQMRNANKKHGNIGDVELFEGNNIIQAWDGKFGKSLFKDAIEELSEKIKSHSKLKIAGFVSNLNIEKDVVLERRISKIEQQFAVKIFILTFEQWINFQMKLFADKKANTITLAEAWLKAYVETLGLKRTHIAPIDEPCQHWVATLTSILSV